MDAEKIIDKLNDIASPAVQHYLEIATERMLVVGWVQIIAAAILLVVTVPVVWSGVKHHNNIGWDPLSPIGVVMVVLGITSILVVPILLINGLPMVIAPEYEAIQSLLSLVK